MKYDYTLYATDVTKNRIIAVIGTEIDETWNVSDVIRTLFWSMDENLYFMTTWDISNLTE